MSQPHAYQVTLRTPTDVLAAVPYLLGFHPTDSAVAVGLRGPRVVFNARADLPPVGGPAQEITDLAMQIAEVLHGQAANAALVVGYGAADQVTRCVLPIRDALVARGVDVIEVLRAADGRYWSYLCTAVRCCPADGVPYDAATTEVAAVATFAGRVVLRDRTALEASLRPTDPQALKVMTEATARAIEELGRPDRQVLRRVGLRALTNALDRHRRGGRLDDFEAATLGLLVAATQVRDLAWERILRAGSSLDPHLELWRDVTRRVRPDLVPAPATLLSFAAWRGGDGALAWVAVDRALRENPDYPMARLMAEALGRAVPPDVMDAPPGGGRRRGARRPSRVVGSP